MRSTARGAGVALIVAVAIGCASADAPLLRAQQIMERVATEKARESAAEETAQRLGTAALERGVSHAEDAVRDWLSMRESAAPASTVRQGEPSPRRPNEPAGFAPWFVHDWQSFPATRDECVVPASGTGYFVFCGVSAHVGRATLINDPGAPHGFGKSLRVHWPAGLPSGRGMFNYAIRSTPHLTSPRRTESAVPLQKWYISTWVYLEPDASGRWEMNFDQLRHFTMNRHVTSGSESGRTIAGWTFRGSRNAAFDSHMRDYRLWGYRCEGCSSTTFARGAPGLPVGQWVHMELLFDRTVKSGPLFALGDAGVGPVRVTYWANGRLVMDEVIRDVYMPYPFMELFFNLNQSGGSAPGTDKYIRLSGTYISGEVYRGG